MSTKWFPLKLRRITFAVPVVIFIIALCPRLLFLYEYRSHPFFSTPQLDSSYYNIWAQRILAGDLAGGTTAYWASPFYAYLIAIFQAFLDSSATMLVRLLQIVLGSVTCLLVYRMGEERFGRRAGIVGAIMLSFYSFSIYMDAELLKNSLAAFTLTASLAIVGSSRKEFFRPFLIAGILLGLTVINMPNVLLLTPAILLFPLLDTKPFRQRFIAAGSICAGMILVISPVTARNWAVERDFVLSTYAGGSAFFFSNNTSSDGGIQAMISDNLFTVDIGKEESSTRAIAEAAVGRHLKSSEISAWWLERGKKHVRDYPLPILGLFMKKIAMFWNWYEVPDNVDFYYIKGWSRLLSQPLVSFGAIAPLAIFGLIIALRSRKRECICDTVIVISFMLSVTLFMVYGRYRLPIVPLLCVYAGHGVSSALNLLRGPLKTNLPGFIVLFLLVIACNLTIIRYSTAHTRMALADIYKQNNNFIEAVALYRDVITEYPHEFDVQLRLRYAYSLEMLGRRMEAISQYEKALSQSADMQLAADIRMVLNDLYDEQRSNPTSQQQIKTDTSN